ncbi:MAG: DUF4241 domain-containing protein [Propionibacteriaceae bacterium]|nr:DUF4241 domain-containing protein [Propionibacteriaceae bacterium]
MEPSELLALRTGTVEGWKYTHSVVPLGSLAVPSGRLEASDPFVNLGEAFVLPIPPGTYPAFVTLADVSEEQDGSHIRETYLSLVIADGEVARVEFANPELADPDEAPGSEEDFYGVPVDAGTVGFADAEAVQRCMPEGNWYEDLFDNDTDGSWFNLMDSPDHLRAGSANIPFPLATGGESVVLTHSGWGDGVYPVLTAFDADGKLLSVHIDLFVNEEDGDEPEEAEPS